MIYREYGKTGKKVSLMGFGGTRFPEELYKTEDGLETCASWVKSAYDHGVNFFDTAHTYCGGKSQLIFRKAFQKINDRDAFYISEKSMISNDPTEKNVRDRIEKTLNALNVDYLDFFHMWSILDIEQYREVIKAGGPYEGALKARDEGLIRHICFSAHCSGDEIVEIIRDGRFEGVTLGYNVINFKHRQNALKAAAEAGLGVAIMNPLAGGVIPRNPEFFRWISEAAGKDIIQASLEFAAEPTAVSTILNGIGSDIELDANLKAFQTLDDSTWIKEIHSTDHSFGDLCTGCRYCQGCPENIPVDKLMLSYNQYMLFHKDAQYLSRYLYDMYGIKEDQIFGCIQCGICEKKCTQHLDIISRIEEINHIADQYGNKLKKKVRDLFCDSETVNTAVYAAGPYAARIFKIYEEVFHKKPEHIYLFDSDSRKWGSEPFLKGMKVRDPQEILTLEIKRIIIASEANYKVIYDALRHLEEEGIEIAGF